METYQWHKLYLILENQSNSCIIETRTFLADFVKTDTTNYCSFDLLQVFFVFLFFFTICEKEKPKQRNIFDAISMLEYLLYSNVMEDKMLQEIENKLKFLKIIVTVNELLVTPFE